MNNAAINKLPLWRLGHVVAWHEEKAKKTSGWEKQRHQRIARDTRKTITNLFMSRLTAGEYDEDTTVAAA